MIRTPAETSLLSPDDDALIIKRRDRPRAADAQDGDFGRDDDRGDVGAADGTDVADCDGAGGNVFDGEGAGCGEVVEAGEFGGDGEDGEGGDVFDVGD